MRAAYLLLASTVLSLVAFGAALGVFGMAWLLGLTLPHLYVLAAGAVVWLNVIALSAATLRIARREEKPKNVQVPDAESFMPPDEYFRRGGRFRAKPPGDAEGN